MPRKKVNFRGHGLYDPYLDTFICAYVGTLEQAKLIASADGWTDDEGYPKTEQLIWREIIIHAGRAVQDESRGEGNT